MFKRGTPQPRGYSWRHMTLEHLMKIRATLEMRCDACRHVAEHSPVWFATMLNMPYDMTLYALAQRLVCKKCGSKRVGIGVKN